MIRYTVRVSCKAKRGSVSPDSGEKAASIENEALCGGLQFWGAQGAGVAMLTFQNHRFLFSPFSFFFSMSDINDTRYTARYFDRSGRFYRCYGCAQTVELDNSDGCNVCWRRWHRDQSCRKDGALECGSCSPCRAGKILLRRPLPSAEEYKRDIALLFKDDWVNLLQEGTCVFGYAAGRSLNLFNNVHAASASLLGDQTPFAHLIQPNLPALVYKEPFARPQPITSKTRIHQLWRSAIRRRNWRLGTSLFVPGIGVEDLLEGSSQRTALANISRTLLEESTRTILRVEQTERSDLLAWDEGVGLNRVTCSGFGLNGCQWWLKCGKAVTPLHDEIGWCAALNLMLGQSDAIALWVGINVVEMAQLVPGGQATIKKWMEEQDLSGVLRRFIELRRWARVHQLRVPELSYLWQHPGDVVHSPAGIGAAHFVITFGRHAEHAAVNAWASQDTFDRCAQFWRGHETQENNTGSATRWFRDAWDESETAASGEDAGPSSSMSE